MFKFLTKYKAHNKAEIECQMASYSPRFGVSPPWIQLRKVKGDRQKASQDFNLVRRYCSYVHSMKVIHGVRVYVYPAGLSFSRHTQNIFFLIFCFHVLIDPTLKVKLDIRFYPPAPVKVDDAQQKYFKISFKLLNEIRFCPSWNSVRPEL